MPTPPRAADKDFISALGEEKLNLLQPGMIAGAQRLHKSKILHKLLKEQKQSAGCVVKSAILH